MRQFYLGGESGSEISQKAGRIGKSCLYIKSTSARPHFYEQAYPQKHSTASPGILVRIMKTVPLSLFAQPDKMSLENWKVLRKPIFWQLLQQLRENKSLGVRTCIEAHSYAFSLILLQCKRQALYLGTLKALDFR